MRTYTAQFNAVSVTAAQDLFEVKGAAGKMVFVQRVKIGSSDTTIASGQMLNVEGVFLPATVTDGSGGTTPAMVKMDAGDAVASCSVLANNTTGASTSGTAAVQVSAGEHVYNGIDLRFAMPGSEGGGLPPAPVIGPSEAWVLKLIAAPTGTLHLNGTVWLGEVGG